MGGGHQGAFAGNGAEEGRTYRHRAWWANVPGRIAARATGPIRRAELCVLGIGGLSAQAETVVILVGEGTGGRIRLPQPGLGDRRIRGALVAWVSPVRGGGLCSVVRCAPVALPARGPGCTRQAAGISG